MTVNDQEFNQAATELESYIQDSPVFERPKGNRLTPSPYAFALPSGLAFIPKDIGAFQDKGATVLTDEQEISRTIPEALMRKLTAEQPDAPATQQPDLTNPRAIWTAFLGLAMNSLCKADGALYKLIHNRSVDMSAVMQAIKTILQNSARWQAAITVAVLQVIALLLLRFSASLVCTLNGYPYPPAPEAS